MSADNDGATAELINYQSTGSDHFVVRADTPDISWAEVAIATCDRNGPLGADGLAVLHPGLPANIPNDRDRYGFAAYTADGNSPWPCVNAVLCAGGYLFEGSSNHQAERLLVGGQEYLLERLPADNTRVARIKFGVFPIQEVDHDALLLMQPADLAALFDRLGIEYSQIRFFDVGTPQLHFLTDGIKESQLNELGETLNDPLLSRNGMNVTAVGVHEGGLRVRTFERGGGGLTSSCATASACAALWSFADSTHVAVATKGGEYTVHFHDMQGDTFSVSIEGLVSPLYRTELPAATLQQLTANHHHIPNVPDPTPFPAAIAAHQAIVARMLQDTGLAAWCVPDIS